MTSIRPVIVFIPIFREPVYMMLSASHEFSSESEYLGVVSNAVVLRVGVGVATIKIIML